MIDRRRADLERHLDDLRKIDGWQPFQHFVLGLLHHEGYTDVRYSAPRSDFGRDAVAITPDGKRCVVAVSFECTKAKVLSDATRFTEDPDREKAEVLLFITSEARAETTWSKWKKDVAKLGLELRMFGPPTILQVATRDRVWRETAARLGLSADRPGFRVVTPYDGEQVRAALRARPDEWLSKRIELREWKELSGELRNRLILGKPGAGKTTTLFMHLEAHRPERVLVVEPDLREGKVEELLDSASGGAVIVFDDAHEKPDELRALLSALRARQRDPGASARYRDVRLLIAAPSQEWADMQPCLHSTELRDLHLTASSQLLLSALSKDQCRELVATCVSEWQLKANDRLINLAAAKSSGGDATPLYVLSLLAPARIHGELKDEHLTHVPLSVLELWQDYWRLLSPVQQGVLRLVKLFALTQAPQQVSVFDAAADAFSLAPHEVSAALSALEKALWVYRVDSVPKCLDVQLQSIVMEESELNRWERFVLGYSDDGLTRLRLLNGTGVYHAKLRARTALTMLDRKKALHAGMRYFYVLATSKGEAESYLRALASISLSTCHADLARFEPTRDGRLSHHHRAVAALQEAINIFNEVGAERESAKALTNLSAQLFDIAALESDRNSRVQRFTEALKAATDAVSVYRQLGISEDLVLSLSNLSSRFAALAQVSSASHEGSKFRWKAVEAAEEAVRISEDLDHASESAAARTNLSLRYSEVADAAKSRANKVKWLVQAVEAVKQAISVQRSLNEQVELAISLINASSYFLALVEQELRADVDDRLLAKATELVDEAIAIYEGLQMPNELAISLGAKSRTLRARAERSVNRVEAAKDLRDSHAAIHQATILLRDIGNTREFLKGLMDLVIISFRLTQAGDSVNLEALKGLCVQGLSLAESMQDGAKHSFFQAVLHSEESDWMVDSAGP
ncbi:MAG TPA: hypothetical protein VFJ16_00345 [Longimicrobium sp.]|nr:hypothetical protein [Longimicrobium sp.]